MWDNHSLGIAIKIMIQRHHFASGIEMTFTVEVADILFLFGVNTDDWMTRGYVLVG